MSNKSTRKAFSNVHHNVIITHFICIKEKTYFVDFTFKQKLHVFIKLPIKSICPLHVICDGEWARYISTDVFCTSINGTAGVHTRSTCRACNNISNGKNKVAKPFTMPVFWSNHISKHHITFGIHIDIFLVEPVAAFFFIFVHHKVAMFGVM